jgi:hypothetical protein
MHRSKKSAKQEKPLNPYEGSPATQSNDGRLINDNLANWIIELSEVERKIELTRQILVENRHFDAVKAFWRVDRREANEINFMDFLAFLDDNTMLSGMNSANLLQ